MRFLIPAVLALSCAPAALAAQEVVQALPGTTDADRLAEQMRAIAANPRDINALIAAADLSLSLGDLSGAASLYARAEKVAPADPRIKAGEGAILVRSERPGEALRYFAQAEAAGYDIRPIAADRALAYDLIGQQERAQRDYRLALKTKADDETIRRYALSLGISGRRDAALEQLDPLLRKSDRSAWRIRAFVLAMGGDQAGAEKIATTMLPAGMAQGLQPFFQRLPTLGPIDRAFAVHFGEVRATPERLADARLTPVLPQLAPEPAPVALAAVQPSQPDRRRGRSRRNREEVAPAVALAANTARPAATPSYQAATAALARVQPVPAQTRPPVALASAVPSVQPVPVRPAPAAIVPSAVATRVVPPPAPVTASVVAATPRAMAPAATVQPLPAAMPVATSAPASAAPVVAAASAPTPGFATAAVQPAAPVAAPAPAAAAPAFTAPPSRAEADSVLARIVAGLTIPAAELGVVEPVRAAPASAAAVPAPDTAARVIAEAKAKEERDAAAEKALAAKAAADKRAADRKAAADKKALAAKKLADAEKLAEAKAAAEEKKAARANPERIWVQVAGGAYEGGLPKAYATMKAKAPAVFGSRAGWTTPLRATNRVLTGPFKTDAEARAFVNQLAKAGVPAFTFTSDAGQVVTKLPAK